MAPSYLVLPRVRRLTLLFLALPALLLLILGSRARPYMPKARDWMNANFWIVNELVLALFVAIVISNIAS